MNFIEKRVIDYWCLPGIWADWQPLGCSVIWAGANWLENLIMDNRSKYGILATKDKAVAENPALLREAMRPSLVT